MQCKYIYNKNLFLQNIFLALIVYYGSISESVFYDFEGMHRGRTVVGLHFFYRKKKLFYFFDHVEIYIV
jgi:hypothetical protein